MKDKYVFSMSLTRTGAVVGAILFLTGSHLAGIGLSAVHIKFNNWKKTKTGK